MNFRSKRGSVTIFVLVGLLFMSSFLIISFGNNINKSKMSKEQFEVLNGIYTQGDDFKEAYHKVYTIFRRKNAQILSESSEDSSAIKLTKTFEDKIKDYKIYGNSIQNGTPRPETPIEVQSVGDKINLIDFFNSNALEYSDKRSKNVYILKNLEDGAKYTISYSFKNSGDICTYLYFYDYDEKGTAAPTTYLTTEKVYNQPYSFTAKSGHEYIICRGGSYTISKSDIDKFNTFQLEKSSSATEYIPYGKYRIQIAAYQKNLIGKNVLRTENWANYDGGNNRYFIYKLDIEDGKTYTLSYDYTNIPTYFYLDWCEKGTAYTNSNEDDNGSGEVKHLITSEEEVGKNYTFTADSKKDYYLWISSGGGDLQNKLNYFKFIQLEEGNIATSYEKPEIKNITLDEPLRKVGSYADYIDFDNKKVVRQVKESIYNGTEDWKMLGTVASTNYYYYLRVGNLGTIQPKIGLNTHFERKDITTSIAGVIGYNPTNSSTYNEDRVIIRPDMNVYTNATLWKSYLSDQYTAGTPVKAYYATVGDTTQVKEDLPELPTFEDNTIIEVLTQVPPSKIEATYYGYTME